MWLDGVEKELEISPFPRVAETFFFGGGTPGVLSAKNIERLGKIFVDKNGGNIPKEWTVELAPSTVNAEKLAVLKEIGVNRISLGIQSFDDATLKILGRIHSSKIAESAFEKIRNAGFENVNLDLIFAVPEEDESRWKRDLKRAVELSPEHISAYCLILEEETPLLRRLKNSQNFSASEKTPEREKALYKTTWAFLRERGYAQYEVANHAKRGRECIHNLNTWRMHEWLGIGPAAASQIGGKRFTNVANLSKWLSGIRAGVPARVDEMTPRERDFFADSLIFGLRTNEGVDVPALSKRFLGNAEISPKLLALFENLERENYLSGTRERGKISLNEDGLLVADAIGEAILSALEE